MDEQATDQTPDPFDALRAELASAPESAEPHPDPLGQLAWRVTVMEGNIRALAREQLSTGVGGGERYATIARIAQDPDAQPEEL